VPESSVLPTAVLECQLLSPRLRVENANNQMLMSQPPNGTRPPLTTVMMLLLLQRRLVIDRKEGRVEREPRKLGERGKTRNYFFF